MDLFTLSLRLADRCVAVRQPKISDGKCSAVWGGWLGCLRVCYWYHTHAHWIKMHCILLTPPDFPGIYLLCNTQSSGGRKTSELNNGLLYPSDLMFRHSGVSDQWPHARGRRGQLFMVGPQKESRRLNEHSDTSLTSKTTPTHPFSNTTSGEWKREREWFHAYSSTLSQQRPPARQLFLASLHTIFRPIPLFLRHLKRAHQIKAWCLWLFGGGALFSWSEPLWKTWSD